MEKFKGRFDTPNTVYHLPSTINFNNLQKSEKWLLSKTAKDMGYIDQKDLLEFLTNVETGGTELVIVFPRLGKLEIRLLADKHLLAHIFGFERCHDMWETLYLMNPTNAAYLRRHSTTLYFDSTRPAIRAQEVGASYCMVGASMSPKLHMKYWKSEQRNSK